MADVPDKEVLRRLEEIKRLLPDAHQLDAVKQVRELARLGVPTNALQAQIRAAREAAAAVISLHHEDIAKAAALAATALRPTLDESLLKQLVSIRNPANDFAQVSIARIAMESAKALNQATAAASLFHIFKSYEVLNDGPMRLALETIRNLQLDARSQLFSEFVTDALRQSTPLTKERVQSLEKEHLPKKRIKELTVKEQIDLKLLVAVLSLLLHIYTFWKPDQPITINPDQIAKLNQPSISITNVFQTMHREPIYYLVVRDCNLIPKPGRTKMVIYALKSGAKVKLVVTNHQWIYVYYENGEIKKEGWIKKKYLKRIP